MTTKELPLHLTHKYYYKIVEDNLKSLCSHFYTVQRSNCDLVQQLPVQYKLNEWVGPNVRGTKLMVFHSLTLALRFNPVKRIYLCEVENPIDNGLFFDACDLAEAISRKNNKKRFMDMVRIAPHGTVFCDKVKLVKLVSSYNYLCDY